MSRALTGKRVSSRLNSTLESRWDYFYYCLLRLCMWGMVILGVEGIVVGLGISMSWNLFVQPVIDVVAIGSVGLSLVLKRIGYQP